MILIQNQLYKDPFQQNNIYTPTGEELFFYEQPLRINKTLWF